eukprot:scaffold20613_cov89-Isochrysis_galbana.AAC.1
MSPAAAMKCTTHISSKSSRAEKFAMTAMDVGNPSSAARASTHAMAGSSARTPSTASHARSTTRSLACGEVARGSACSVWTARSKERGPHRAASAVSSPKSVSRIRLRLSAAACAASRPSAPAADTAHWTCPGTRPRTCARAASAVRAAGLDASPEQAAWAAAAAVKAVSTARLEAWRASAAPGGGAKGEARLPKDPPAPPPPPAGQPPVIPTSPLAPPPANPHPACVSSVPCWFSTAATADAVSASSSSRTAAHARHTTMAGGIPAGGPTSRSREVRVSTGGCGSFKTLPTCMRQVRRTADRTQLPTGCEARSTSPTASNAAARRARNSRHSEPEIAHRRSRPRRARLAEASRVSAAKSAGHATRAAHPASAGAERTGGGSHPP